MKYNRICFSSHDEFKSFTLYGTPDKYEAELPRDYTDYKTLKTVEIPLPEDFLPLVLANWYCYRAYIDTKPDDDAPLTPEELDDIEEDKKMFSTWVPPDDLEGREKWRHDKAIKDAKDAEERDARIKKELAAEKEKWDAEEMDFKQKLEEKTRISRETHQKFLDDAKARATANTDQILANMQTIMDRFNSAKEMIKNLTARNKELSDELAKLRPVQVSTTHLIDTDSLQLAALSAHSNNA